MKTKLTKLIQCKLNQEDYESYLNKVKSSGYTQSEFLRLCILNNKTQIINPRLVNNLLSQLVTIGNNLSYIANKIDIPSIENYEQVLELLYQIKIDVQALKEFTLPHVTTDQDNY